MVTFAASVRALVARVSMKVSISVHQPSVVFFNRLASGSWAICTYSSNFFLRSRATATVAVIRVRRSCILDAPGGADLVGGVVGAQDVVELGLSALGQGVVAAQ